MQPSVNHEQKMQEDLAQAFREFLMSRGQTNILPDLANVDIQLKICAKVKTDNQDTTTTPAVVIETPPISINNPEIEKSPRHSVHATLDASLGDNYSLITEQGKRSKDKSTDPDPNELFGEESTPDQYYVELSLQAQRYIQNKNKIMKSARIVPFNCTELSSIRHDTVLNLTKDGGSSSKKIPSQLLGQNTLALKKFRSKLETTKKGYQLGGHNFKSSAKNTSWSEHWLNALQSVEMFEDGTGLPGRLINKTISRSFETLNKSSRNPDAFREGKLRNRLKCDHTRIPVDGNGCNPILQSLGSMQDLESTGGYAGHSMHRVQDPYGRHIQGGEMGDKSRSACVTSSNVSSARKVHKPDILVDIANPDSQQHEELGSAASKRPMVAAQLQTEAGLDALLAFHTEMFSKPDPKVEEQIATDEQYKKKSRREPNYEQNLEELDKVGKDLADLYQSLELDEDIHSKKKTKISYLIQEREQHKRFGFEEDGPTLIDLLENVKERDPDESTNYLKKLAGLGGTDLEHSPPQAAYGGLSALEQLQNLDHQSPHTQPQDTHTYDYSDLKSPSYPFRTDNPTHSTQPPESTTSPPQASKIDLWISDLLKKVGDDPDIADKLRLIKATQEEEQRRLRREHEEALMKAAESEKRAMCYERQLKQVENFTNSYNSQSMSRDTPGNSSLGFKNMLNLLGDLYETEDVSNTMKMFQNYKESNLHFCFMFASPLVIFRATVNGNVLQTIPWEIEYNRDLSLIKKTLRNVGCDIKFMSAKASASTFVEVMKKNPMILHFCGHGVDNTRGAQQRRPTEEKLDNYYLLFEDHLGRGEPIVYDHLEQMLCTAYKGRNNLEFVFVASCHSEIIGQVFLNAGASHVLCVAKDEKISDDICKTFAELYYQSFFCESLTFCEAFEAAKRKIAAGKFFNGEEHKFMMLLRPNMSGQPHRCTRFLSKPSPESKFMDLTPVPLFNLPHFTQECFLGRNKEIYEVIDLLYNNRFVSIKGTIGIGKSSLAKEIVNKLLDRGVFTHGIIYVDMKRDTSIERMFSVIINNQTLNKLVRKRSHNKEFDLQQAMDDVISILKEYEVLLVFDNLDNIYVKSPGPIKSFFETVINSTLGVKIMITLFSKIESIQSNFVEIVYELGPLTDSHAAQLLIKRATRRVTENEIMKLYSDHACAWNSGRPTLEGHKLIKLFNGLPQAILMAASILHEKSLSEIYYLLKNSPVSPNVLNPLMMHAGSHDTVKVSVSLALEIVKEMEELANLALVGFFPAGVLEMDLPNIWGAYYQNSLQKLQGHSVLYKQQYNEDCNYYTINGFLLEELAKSQAGEELNYLKYLLPIMTEKLERYFLTVGTVAQKKPDALFLFEEPNIQHFYQRLREFYRSQGWEPSQVPSQGIIQSLKSKAAPQLLSESRLGTAANLTLNHSPHQPKDKDTEKLTPTSRDSLSDAQNLHQNKENPTAFNSQQEPTAPSSYPNQREPHAHPALVATKSSTSASNHPQAAEYLVKRELLAKMIPVMEKKLSSGSTSNVLASQHDSKNSGIFGKKDKDAAEKPTGQNTSSVRSRKLSTASTANKHSRTESARSEEHSETSVNNGPVRQTILNKTRESSTSSKDSKLTDRSVKSKVNKAEEKGSSVKNQPSDELIDGPKKQIAQKKYLDQENEIKEVNEVDTSVMSDTNVLHGEEGILDGNATKPTQDYPIEDSTKLVEVLSKVVNLDSPIPQEATNTAEKMVASKEVSNEQETELTNSGKKTQTRPSVLGKAPSKRKNSGSISHIPEATRGSSKNATKAPLSQRKDVTEPKVVSNIVSAGPNKSRTTSILSKKKAGTNKTEVLNQATQQDTADPARPVSIETERNKVERKVRFDGPQVKELPSIQSETSENEGKDGRKSLKSVGRSSTGRSSIGTPKSNGATEGSKRPPSKLSSSSSSVASRTAKRPLSARSGGFGAASSQPNVGTRPQSGKKPQVAAAVLKDKRTTEQTEPILDQKQPSQDLAAAEYTRSQSSSDQEGQPKESNHEDSQYDSDDSDNQQKSSQLSDFEDVKYSQGGYTKDPVQERSSEESHDSGIKNIDKIDEVESLEEVFPQMPHEERLSLQNKRSISGSHNSSGMEEPQKTTFLDEPQPEQISIVGPQPADFPYDEVDIDFGNFDRENDGEIEDPMENKILTEDTDVPVISGNLAEAVLAPIDEPLSFSTSSYSRSQVENQSQDQAGKDANLPSDVFSWRQSLGVTSKQVLKKQELNSLANSGVLGVVPGSNHGSTGYKEPAHGVSGHASASHSSSVISKSIKPTSKLDQEHFGNNHSKLEEHSVAGISNSTPHQMKKNPSNVTPSYPSKKSNAPTSGINSSMISRQEQSHSAAGTGHKATPSLNHSILNSTSNTVNAERSMQLVAAAKKLNYEQFQKSTNNCASKYLVLYASLLVLQPRSKEANKEVNALFNIALHNEDMWLLIHAAKLKLFLLFNAKKYEEAAKFSELLGNLAKLGKFELYSVMSMYVTGCLKLIQGEMSKAKLSFTTAMRGYRYMDHLYGEYSCCSQLKKIFAREKRELEAKEIQEKLKKFKNIQNIKNCINGRKHKYGTFLMRTKGEMCSMLIELEVKKLVKDDDDPMPKGFKFKNGLRIAQTLYDDYCK